MSRSLALVLASSVSSLPQDDLRSLWKANKADQEQAQDKVFSSMLHHSIGEGVKAALGQAILGILSDQGLFDNALDPKEFHRKLQTVFGNGATVIEKIIIKELFRKLSLPYSSSDFFSYSEDLERARRACVTEAPTK
ncbi:MAG TPA: hypothetical protein VFE96_08300 [Candidatus Bathyarchaeia archaeon]|jgi:hypothetical protein|nr:hypothetical protein [Candidatus Bathyarchaeia archaeon]